jgi:hypothetical protein
MYTFCISQGNFDSGSFDGDGEVALFKDELEVLDPDYSLSYAEIIAAATEKEYHYRGQFREWKAFGQGTWSEGGEVFRG